jgi:hypothetical protein
MARRLAALAGMVILLVLALTLLWRVYLHHIRVNPDEPEMPGLAFSARRLPLAVSELGPLQPIGFGSSANPVAIVKISNDYS